MTWVRCSLSEGLSVKARRQRLDNVLYMHEVRRSNVKLVCCFLAWRPSLVSAAMMVSKL